jgi:hypothetical protein
MKRSNGANLSDVELKKQPTAQNDDSELFQAPGKNGRISQFYFFMLLLGGAATVAVMFGVTELVKWYLIKNNFDYSN